MTIDEIYTYYNRNWSQVARELKIGVTTYTKWLKKGYIPIETQVAIEKKTNGLFKANLKHLGK